MKTILLLIFHSTYVLHMITRIHLLPEELNLGNFQKAGMQSCNLAEACNFKKIV